MAGCGAMVESPASRAQLDEGKSFRDVVCSIWKGRAGCLWAWLARPQPSKSKSKGESESERRRQTNRNYGWSGIFARLFEKALIILDGGGNGLLLLGCGCGIAITAVLAK